MTQPNSTALPSDQPDSNDDGRPFTASLVGWYGFANAGDDAFFAVLCKWIIESFGATRISVSGCNQRLPKTDLPASVNIFGNEGERVLGRIARFFQEPKNLFGHDLVIFGGGSIFSRRRFWWLAVQFWTAKFLRRIGISDVAVGAAGVSIGPFYKFGDQFWCKQILRQFDIITVRDRHSWELGEQYGLKGLIPSMDLALALPLFFPVETRKHLNAIDPSPCIGFSVVDRDAEYGNTEVDDVKRAALVEALCEVAAKFPDASFKGFVFCKHEHLGDHAATEKVLDALSNAGCQVELVGYENDPIGLCNEIAKLNAMICNRMHSFVFSCIVRTPAAMISYAPKMDEFAKSVSVPSELIFAHDKLDAKRLESVILDLLKTQSLPCDVDELEEHGMQVRRDLDAAATVLRSRHPHFAMQDIEVAAEK